MNGHVNQESETFREIRAAKRLFTKNKLHQVHTDASSVLEYLIAMLPFRIGEDSFPVTWLHQVQSPKPNSRLEPIPVCSWQFWRFEACVNPTYPEAPWSQTA